MSLPRLVVRADASARMGIGHLMRCLSLASGWTSRGGRTTFISASDDTQLHYRIRSSGAELVRLEAQYPSAPDLATTVSVLDENPDSWVVLDGYHFDSRYQYEVRSTGARLMIIDDYASSDHYIADLLLNQNIDAKLLRYSHETYTQMLLGPQYALLSPRFGQWQDWHKPTPDVARRILITLGGGDPDNQTCKVLRAIRTLKVADLEVLAVVGDTNPHLEALEHEVAGTNYYQLRQNVDNMPELMAWADMAVSAGGSTCWELAYMGLPNLILVLAQNQAAIAAGLHQTDISENLGWFQEVDEETISQRVQGLIHNPSRRSEMSRLGRQLVDGRGVDRVIGVLLEFSLQRDQDV